METFKRIIEIMDANLIACLIPFILTIMLVKHFFRNKFETRKALNVIRWAMIIFTLSAITFFVIELLFNKDKISLMDRPRLQYSSFYWLMLLSPFVLPLLLLLKKLGTNFYAILFIAFCMKLGHYIEGFIILITEFHRDYSPNNGNHEITNSVFKAIGLICIQGMLMAILLLGLFELIKKLKHPSLP